MNYKKTKLKILTMQSQAHHKFNFEIINKQLLQSFNQLF